MTQRQQGAPNAPAWRPEVPEWTLGDRMTRALRHANIGVSEAAEYMGVARATVGRWINDRGPVSHMALMLWAQMTGVDQQWLETGQASSLSDSTPVEEVTPASIPLPRLDSNQQPSGYRRTHLRVVNGGLTPNRTVAERRTGHLRGVS